MCFNKKIKKFIKLQLAEEESEFLLKLGGVASWCGGGGGGEARQSQSQSQRRSQRSPNSLRLARATRGAFGPPGMRRASLFLRRRCAHRVCLPLLLLLARATVCMYVSYRYRYILYILFFHQHQHSLKGAREHAVYSQNRNPLGDDAFLKKTFFLFVCKKIIIFEKRDSKLSILNCMNFMNI